MREDNFQIIIDILAALERQLDAGPNELNWKAFAPETLGVNVNRWAKILTMLEEEKLIKGFSFGIQKGQIINNSGNNGRLTMKGLEYLKNNK